MSLILPEEPDSQARRLCSLFPAGRRVELILRLLLGGAFVYAGILKAQDPTAFLYSIRSFEILQDPWAPLMAVSLPWLEILCGLAVISRRLYAGALTILNVSLLAFLWALAWSWHRGLDVDCGCFGKADFGDSYPYYILRDLVLLTPALWLLLREFAALRRRKSTHITGKAV